MMALLVLLPPRARRGGQAARPTPARCRRAPGPAEDRLAALTSRPPAVADRPTVPLDGDVVSVDGVTWSPGATGSSSTTSTCHLTPRASGSRSSARPGARHARGAADALRGPGARRRAPGSHWLPELALGDVRGTVGLVDDDPSRGRASSPARLRGERAARPRPSATDDEVEGALRQARLGGWLDSTRRPRQLAGRRHAQVSMAASAPGSRSPAPLLADPAPCWCWTSRPPPRRCDRRRRSPRRSVSRSHPRRARDRTRGGHPRGGKAWTAWTGARPGR